MAAERRVNQFVISNTEAVMHISGKEASRRHLRSAFDEMQRSSTVALSWYEEHLTRMKGSCRQSADCRSVCTGH
eukprot:10942058-Lingulodinium_polyedra.AAC.1